MSRRTVAMVSVCVGTLGACVGLASARQAVAPDHDPAHTLTLDAVALCQGRETPGHPDWSVTRDATTYWFADAASRDEFLDHPETYEVQFNGACARMGPLSGYADARRFAVHDGRIYLFASESCRATFLRHADRLIERDDREPLPAQCEDARGREALAKALEWAGGADRLQAIHTYIERRVVPYESDNVIMDHTITLAIEFGDAGVSRVFREDDWRQYGAWGEAAAGTQAWRTSKDPDSPNRVPQPLVASQRRSLDRQVLAHPLVTLIDAAAGRCLVAHVGTEGQGDAAVERVLLHRAGVSVTLLIEGESGRLVGLEHRARGGASQLLGTRRLLFTTFETIDGLNLPVAWDVVFDDVPEDASPPSSVELELNTELDPAWFPSPDA